MARNIKVLISVVGFYIGLVAIYQYLEGHRTIVQEVSIDELNGTWVIVRCDWVPRARHKSIRIIIRDSHAELVNFPDLTEFSSPEKFDPPMIQYRNMTVPLRVQAMPSGWGIDILDNHLRFVNRRGCFSMVNTPDVKIPSQITVYQRVYR